MIMKSFICLLVVLLVMAAIAPANAASLKKLHSGQKAKHFAGKHHKLHKHHLARANHHYHV